MKYLFTTFVFSLLFSFSNGASINRCDIKFSENNEEYINSIMGDLYYSIEGKADELEAGLSFGNERFPFQLSFSLNKSEYFSHIPLTLSLSDLMTGLRNRANYDFDGHDKVHQVTNMYQQYVNIVKDLIDKNPSLSGKVTVHNEKLAPITSLSDANISFYSDMKTLKIFLDFILKNEVKSVFGTYDPSRIIFHDKQYNYDQARNGVRGLSILHKRKGWLEGVEHHLILRENAKGTPRKKIVDELNLYEATMREIENKRYVYKVEDIQKVVDHEITRTKHFRTDGQVYYKNKNGQSTFNPNLLRELVEENFRDKRKGVEEVMNIINQELNQLPYNRYLYVPLDFEETSQLIYHILNTLSPRDVAALMMKNKKKK